MEKEYVFKAPEDGTFRIGPPVKMEVQYISQPDDWEISVSPVGETFSWYFRGTESVRIMLDPFLIRDAFYRLKTPAQLLEFLRQSGPFRAHGGMVTWPKVQEWQAYLKLHQERRHGFGAPPEYREGETDRIVSPPFKYYIREVKGLPQLVNFVVCESVVEAIAGANAVEKLCAVETETCPWCKLPFVKTNKRSIFCGHKCAHSAATRERRKKQKENNNALLQAR